MVGVSGLLTLLLYYNSCVCDGQRRSAALFPSAVRVKRGAELMVNPIFQRSLEDVNLLFEILLAGVRMDSEGDSFAVLDEELASLRRTRPLEAVCDSVLPRKLTDIRRLTAKLLQGPAVLRRDDFERTVLTMVYVTRRMANTTGHQRDAWAGAFVSLYRAIKQDLFTV